MSETRHVSQTLEQLTVSRGRSISLIVACTSCLYVLQNVHKTKLQWTVVMEYHPALLLSSD